MELLQSPSLPISDVDITISSSQSSIIICSSDQGELEEEAARMLGEDYWLEDKDYSKKFINESVEDMQNEVEVREEEEMEEDIINLNFSSEGKGGQASESSTVRIESEINKTGSPLPLPIITSSVQDPTLALEPFSTVKTVGSPASANLKVTAATFKVVQPPSPNIPTPSQSRSTSPVVLSGTRSSISENQHGLPKPISSSSHGRSKSQSPPLSSNRDFQTDQQPLASTSRIPYDSNHTLESSLSPVINSPSPTPPIPIPILSLQPEPEPEPELFGARSFRQRTAAQLKPYSIENAKYTRTMVKNGWQGAVVIGPRILEETEEEMRIRKNLAELNPRDNLGGWLEFEEGQEIRNETTQDASSSRRKRRDSDEESYDGDQILEREARRRDLEMERAFGLVEHQPKSRNTNDSHRYERDGSNGPPRPRPRKRIPQKLQKLQKARDNQNQSIQNHKLESKKRSHEAVEPDSRRYLSEGDSSPRKVHHKRNRLRAGSEPPSSPLPSSANITRGQTSTKSIPRPSKSFHISKRPRDRFSTIDQAILDLSSPLQSIQPPQQISIDSTSEEEQSDTGSSSSNHSIEVAEIISKTRLGGKKKKALRSMMPAVFMKKAQADLKLMEQEALGGYASGSDQGSGDGASDSSNSDGVRTAARVAKLTRGRGIIKKGSKDPDGFLNLDENIFTDESGDDGRPQLIVESSSEEEEEELDTLPAWIKGYARPRRPDGEDTVARFLRQAKTRKPSKSKSKSKSSSKREQVSGVNAKSYQFGDSNNRPKNGLTSKTRIGPRHIPTYNHRTSIKSIALDTDEALFEQVPSFGKSSTTDYVEVRSRSVLSAVPERLDLLEDVSSTTSANIFETERWALYKNFSHDFNIQKLKVGTQFPATSYVGSGHLYGLVSPLPTTNRARFTRAFEISFDSSISAEELQTMLPNLCDATYDAIVGEDDDIEYVDTSLREAFKFLGNYLLEVLPSFDNSVLPRFLVSLSSQISQLKSRLKSYCSSITITETSITFKKLLLLSLYLVDIAARIVRLDPSNVTYQDHYKDSITSLMRQLISHGPKRTTKSLKSLVATEVESQDPLILHDTSAEAWLCLIGLALSTEVTLISFGPSEFWEMVTDTVIKSLPGSSLRTPVGGEILSYTATMLCAISQFSPSGFCTSIARLPAHWSILIRTLDFIQPDDLAKSDHTTSNAALAKRDRYLWTLFARGLVFAERWNWSISTQDDLAGKLFDLVNARRLSDLTIESEGDFPPFLARIDQLDKPMALAKGDTLFIIFLKILIKTANDIPHEPVGERRKQLTRLFLRLTPMTTGPWTQLSPEIHRGTSILINNYSLYMTFAALSPSSINQRLDQARRLLNLPEVNEAPRRTLIRAILYFTLIFRHNKISITSLVDWISSVAKQLKIEYVESERDLIKKSRGDIRAIQGSRAREADETALWNRAVLLSMVLRSVQVVVNAQKSTINTEPAYPELELLQPALTTQILESPLALIPIVGNELLDLIECFLDVRTLVIHPRRVIVEEAAGISQDEFGIFDMDFEDPALNAMLGVGAPSQSNTQSENMVKDKALVKFISSSLSPSLFRLLSNIYAPKTGIIIGPKALDQTAFAESVLQCWTRCITILVENDLADWISYLRYGDNSWKRLGDPVGRREVGLLLAIHLSRYDDTFFQKYQAEFLEIWFQTIAFPTLINQHKLTYTLVNMDKPSDFFSTVPFARDLDSNKFVVELSDLQANRIALLRCVIQKAGQLLKQAQMDKLLPKPTVLNYIRDMLISMQNNLEVIPSEGSRREYSNFCRTILDEIKSTSSLNEQNLPSLRALYQAVS